MLEHHAAHGAWPGALSQVCDDAVVRTDPFSGREFIYRHESVLERNGEAAFILYSVGEDGEDNGGTHGSWDDLFGVVVKDRDFVFWRGASSFATRDPTHSRTDWGCTTSAILSTGRRRQMSGLPTRSIRHSSPTWGRASWPERIARSANVKRRCLKINFGKGRIRKSGRWHGRISSRTMWSSCPEIPTPGLPGTH